MKMCNFPIPPAEKIREHVCPAVSFPSSETCLFNDGTGKLYLINTGRRDEKLEKQSWDCVVPTAVCDMSFPFYVCTATTDAEESIHCAVMSLEDEKLSAKGHPKVFLHSLELVQNNKETHSAGDRFVVQKNKTLAGSYVPNYVSYSPDFSTLVIASQGKYKLAEQAEQGNSQRQLPPFF